MNRLLFLLKHAYKKLLIDRLYKKFVVDNSAIQQDIEQTIAVRGCDITPNTIEKKFSHLMHYYSDFALLFFWRIKGNSHKWRTHFTKDIDFKIFRSTKIAGGMMCYHPFSTVINAKSIGANFQFRNGLTIGNKGNDNTKTPVIGSNVTVGANVVIIGDIVIGDHVVIGAGSVVVKDVPSNCVIAGNPARIIKQVAL
jgi:serine acetyltransferase